jgi:preprotein translocase subunit YajC
MFITDAYAQATAGGLEGAGASIMQFLPIILVVFIMYMLMWRPQQKKMKAHKAMIAAVKRGDRVVAAGGIIGTVSKVIDDGEVQIEVADGVRMRVLRSSINDVLNRSDGAKIQDNTPEKAEKPEKKGDAR